MSLAVGSRIGSYEVLELLGAGGMGEVYRARDSKLKRDVALKVLPDALAHDADRLSRFQREAELLATLNHPHIAAIYGLEDSGGVAAIVLELVDGETLADRIARGAIPIDEALPIAVQIADALESAHDRGIVHRDLKPANIKITADGGVKMLDFGLAKALDAGGAPGASPTNLTFSPTLSVHATMQGVILGTAGYMSPEQARGKAIDRRTDVWAFGCVLFEMLTATQAFAGETVTDIVAAIVKNEPDWAALPADTPPHIRALLRRCLQKDPRKRLPHIGVARQEIEEGPAAFAEGAPMSAAPSRRALLLVAWTIAAVAAVLAAGLGAALVLRPRPIDRGAVRFSISPPQDMTFGQNVSQRGTAVPAPHFAPSPDGHRLAYVMYKENEKAQLWVRRLDALSAQPLPATDDASFPFWSPDGRSIAFFAQGKLKKIDASGGPPQTICDAPAGEGGTWNRDGVIVFAPDGRGGLFKVAASGGVATQVTKLERDETSHGWPQFLPDGRHFLYLAISGGSRTPTSTVDASRSIYAGALDSADRTPILQGVLRSAYANGHLLFIREGTLMAQRFDAASLRLTGDPVPVAEQVAANTGNGRTAFAVSESGMLVYRNGGSTTGVALLTWFDRTGKRLGMVSTGSEYGAVALSPDGTALVATIAAPPRPGDLWLLSLARANVPSRLTFTPDEAKVGVIWSPDSSRIAFASGPVGQAKNIYQKKADGVSDPELLLDSQASANAVTLVTTSWSPDGRYIAFDQSDRQTNFDSWLLPLAGDRKPVPFLKTAFNESSATFSPDGHWIAYLSDKSGTNDVYIRPFPTGDREWRISEGGGTSPRWRADGRELFYVVPSLRALMAVPIKAGSTLEPGQPARLFEFPLLRNGGARQYAVTPDGQRLLIIEPQAAALTMSGSPIIVVINWASGLTD